MTGRVLLDSDVLIWHLRGNPTVVRLVQELAERGEILISAISRAEVLLGMRAGEESATLRLLDALQTSDVDRDIADLAATMVRGQRVRGVTWHLPDALIAATSIIHGAVLYTCNARHFSDYRISVTTVEAK